MPNRQNGSILPVFLIAVLIVLGTLGYLYYKNSILKEYKQTPQEQIEQVTSVVKPSPFETIKKTPTDINWIDHINKDKGISFKLPEGWNVFYAGGEDFFEIDIHDPDQNSFLLISIQSSSAIKDESDIRETISIAQKEKSVLSRQEAKLSDFKSIVNGTTGSYTAIGEEPYFALKEANNLEDMEVLIYNFQERGLYEIGKRTAILHGITIPGSNKDIIINKIMDSFSLIP